MLGCADETHGEAQNQGQAWATGVEYSASMDDAYCEGLKLGRYAR
jgi:hypothetical protein